MSEEDDSEYVVDALTRLVDMDSSVARRLIVEGKVVAKDIGVRDIMEKFASPPGTVMSFDGYYIFSQPAQRKDM